METLHAAKMRLRRAGLASRAGLLWDLKDRDRPDWIRPDAGSYILLVPDDQDLDQARRLLSPDD
jgi:hypothetical protein